MNTRAFGKDFEGGIPEAIIAFCHYTRREGLNVGVQESLDALQAAACGLLTPPSAFRYSLRALFCTSPEERAHFDRLFDAFWDTRSEEQLRPKKTIVNQAKFVRNHEASLVMLGQGKTEGEEDEGKNVSGANAVERLRKTDFSKLTEIESELLAEVARQLWKEMSRRIRRRRRKAARQGPIDLRRTIRRSIATGGDPIEPARRDRKPRKQRLIVLLDISGSMDKYSFFLLRFIFALREHFRHLEAFIFSTYLQRITGLLEDRGVDKTLALLSEKADHWSSGTKIGACLGAFNEQYGKRVLNGNSLVLILSDGLDTGEPSVLAAELQKIGHRCRRLVWLNPLKGMSGYAPTARGMNAALPLVDDFRSAHSLDSLLELENLLIHV